MRDESNNTCDDIIPDERGSKNDDLIVCTIVLNAVFDPVITTIRYLAKHGMLAGELAPLESTSKSFPPNSNDKI